jgi:hypothetical protein
MKKSKKTTFTKALSVHAIIRRRENNLLTIPLIERVPAETSRYTLSGLSQDSARRNRI